MCECYMIGGPWIEEDPNCPVHGVEAKREREEAEAASKEMEDRLKALETKLHDAERRIRELESK